MWLLAMRASKYSGVVVRGHHIRAAAVPLADINLKKDRIDGQGTSERQPRGSQTETGKACRKGREYVRKSDQGRDKEQSAER